MGFNRFGLVLGVRLTLLLLALSGAGYLMVIARHPVASLLAVALVVLLGLQTVRFVSRTNQELARFLDAVRYADFGQRFQLSGLGAGFEELGETFTHILGRFRADRSHQETVLRHLKAILEHVPVPLISVHGDRTVTLWNNAARRLLGPRQIHRLEDLEAFGADLPARISSIRPGERTLVGMEVDGSRQSITLSSSEIVTPAGTERLISLHNIQTELDGMQLAAWQDLVRVLTHEIMNSITPVSSLAKTAADLVDDVSGKLSREHGELVDELGDVRDAVATVARRSDGLMGFVQNYRRLLGLPQPERSRFRIRELLDDVARIAAVGWAEAGISLHCAAEPESLTLNADRRLLEQVLINLLQNAGQALASPRGGNVWLSARLNPQGRVLIEVADDGPGIPEEVAARMFVPFYTTRKDGSGVGLALSRQIMNAHGGTLSFANRDSGGARFTLGF